MSRTIFCFAFFLLSVFVSTTSADPIRTLGGLDGIRVYEQSGSLREHFFAPEAAALNRIFDLTGEWDFTGTSTELYDVYYSDADGTANFDGSWITIDALFPTDTGGFNINDVRLEFNGASSIEYADRWSRVVAMGTTGSAGSVVNAIDGNLGTWTTLGFSTDNNNRLSITVGFASSVPEPSSSVLLLLGTIFMVTHRSRKRRCSQDWSVK